MDVSLPPNLKRKLDEMSGAVTSPLPFAMPRRGEPRIADVFAAYPFSHFYNDYSERALGWFHPDTMDKIKHLATIPPIPLNAYDHQTAGTTSGARSTFENKHQLPTPLLTFPTGSPKREIDHVFCDARSKWHAYTIYTAECDDASDHRPLVAELGLKLMED